MSAQELSVYTPGNEEWQKNTGDIRYTDNGDNSPGTSSPARQLYANDKFEVTEIPGAMTKMGWHTSAALLNKWFSHAPKNQATNAFQKAHGFNQDGTVAYPNNCFDKDTIKLDWVLSYPRTQSAFKKLQQSSYLNAGRASDQLARVLAPYRDRSMIDTVALTGGDIQKLHNTFQFQLVRVDTTALEKASQFFGAMLHHGKPDDLAGAPGGFFMCAAVAEARFKTTLIGAIEVSVTKVAIYVKNPYSFFDDPSQGGSQYLGHWNKDSICLVPEGYVAQRENFGSWSNYIIRPEGPYGRTFWPVHNSDFRRWQDQHNAGGDMVLFTNYRVVKIDPITFRLKK